MNQDISQVQAQAQSQSQTQTQAQTVASSSSSGSSNNNVIYQHIPTFNSQFTGARRHRETRRTTNLPSGFQMLHHNYYQ